MTFMMRQSRITAMAADILKLRIQLEDAECFECDIEARADNPHPPTRELQRKLDVIIARYLAWSIRQTLTQDEARYSPEMAQALNALKEARLELWVRAHEATGFHERRLDALRRQAA